MSNKDYPKEEPRPLADILDELGKHPQFLATVMLVAQMAAQLKGMMKRVKRYARKISAESDKVESKESRRANGRRDTKPSGRRPYPRRPKPPTDGTLADIGNGRNNP